MASQTAESLRFTGSSTDYPIFRPLIGMDKEEVISISRKIDTFDVSIQPYEDCCTVFTPKHPKTKPVLEEVIKEQNKLDCENLVERAVEGVKLTVIE